MPSGFVDRYKGKIYQPTGSLQQIGSGGAVTLGGGQINTTSAMPASSAGAALSSGAVAETTLLSYTLPAKTLDRPGRSLFLQAWGTFSTFNAGQKTARLYFGNEAVTAAFSTAAGTAPASPLPWNIQMSVFAQSTLSTVSVQSLIGQGVSTAHQGATFFTASENMTVASTIKVTGISSASTAAGDVIAYGLQVEGLN